MSNSNFKNWILAARLRTLPAGIAPVFLGTAMAFGDGLHDLSTALMCLLGAVLIQLGTNLANDYFDFQKGADTHERIGPTRVTQSGLISPRDVLSATVLVFCLAALVSVGLVIRGGWPIAVIGILSIISGVLYTAGPRPLGYLGLGELFVFIFFGPIAVGGTYYVQSFELNTAVILAGFATGLLSSAILVVNNLRDIDTDRAAGKLTLAVRFGTFFAQAEYFVFIILGCLMPILIYWITRDHLETVFASFVLILSFPSLRAVFSQADGPSLNHALVYTGKLLLIHTVLFSIGWIV